MTHATLLRMREFVPWVNTGWLLVYVRISSIAAVSGENLWTLSSPLIVGACEGEARRRWWWLSVRHLMRCTALRSAWWRCA